MKKRRVRNKTTGIEGRGASSVTPRQMAAHQRLSALLQAGLLSDGVHFLSVRQGKPILLKAGAEMVMLACGLAPRIVIRTRDDGEHHRDFRVTMMLYNQQGSLQASGVGCCSTMESGYSPRQRVVRLLPQPVPHEYWELRRDYPERALEVIGGDGYSVVKDDKGVWRIGRYLEQAQPDPPVDRYNRCLKIAKKRALVDAVLTATAGSAFFTQDQEEQHLTIHRQSALRERGAA